MKHQLKILFAAAGLLAAFVPASQAQTYYVAGPAGNWSATAYGPMTAGPNSGEYSLTITGTVDTYDQCKVTDGTWDNSWPSSDNLEFLYDSTGSATIHFWPGSTTDGWAPLANRVGYDDPDNDPGWSIAGSFNGWGTAANLAALGSGVYSNTVVDTSDTPPGPMFFKFQSPQNSWSDINFASPDFGNGNGNGSYPITVTPQSLPVVLDLPDGRYYVGAPALPPTNYITFQLDMTVQVVYGNFTNTDLNPLDANYGLPVNSVAVAGDFIGWGTGAQLTNYTILNPGDLNPGLKTNLYIGTFPDQTYLPVSINWKFRVNSLDGGYELPLSTAGGNRVTAITSANQVLPVTLYDDAGITDYVETNTWVTFSIYCPDQTVGPGPVTFTKGSDTIWVSGGWLGWPTWGFEALPGNQQMIGVGSSDVYTNTLLVPRGTTLSLTYKYSFDGLDNENGSNTNHIRYIRTFATNYAFPQDVWS